MEAHIPHFISDDLESLAHCFRIAGAIQPQTLSAVRPIRLQTKEEIFARNHQHLAGF